MLCTIRQPPLESYFSLRVMLLASLMSSQKAAERLSLKGIEGFFRSPLSYFIYIYLQITNNKITRISCHAK